MAKAGHWKPTKKQLYCLDNSLCFKCETGLQLHYIDMGGGCMVESYYCPKCTPEWGDDEPTEVLP